jgi:hypothetical protein
MTEMVRRFIVAGAVVTLPLAATAEQPQVQTLADGGLSYALFEAGVPHVDLADCPEVLASDERFCRLTLGAEGPVVWAFALDGDQPLQAVMMSGTDALLR